MFREPHPADESLPTDVKKGKDVKALRSLWPFVSPYKGMIFVILLSVTVAALTVIGVGAGLKYLVDNGFSQGDGQWLNWTLLGLFGVVFLMALSSYARLYSVSWLGERVVADLREKIFNHLLTLDINFFETTSIGEIQSRLTTDTTLLQVVISTSLPIAIRNVLIILGGLIMLLVTSPSLTGHIALLIPLILVPILFLGKRVRQFSKSTQDKTAGLSTRLDETFSFIRTVRSYCREHYVQQQFKAQILATQESSMTRIKARALMTSFVMVLVFGGISLVLWTGSKAVFIGDMTVGGLSSFLFYAIAVAGSFGSLSEIYSDLQKAAGAIERILEFLALEPEMTVPEPAYVLDPLGGEIFFKKVSFAYPSRIENPVIRDVTFQINPGEMIALVGPSGGGKSTLFSLIQRFYDPTLGSILLDGFDIKTLDLESIRSQMAIVSQDPAIFSTSIRENIAFGSLGATQEEIVAAAKAAYADGFIERLPQQYDTLVGEKGVQLSGGERQRIAIARALLCDPKVLLLDEATSALDTESERKVQDALEDLMKDRTTLVIAHRLSTVQKADRILVIDHGRIMAWGTHGELIKQPGLYQNLANLQLVG